MNKKHKSDMIETSLKLGMDWENVVSKAEVDRKKITTNNLLSGISKSI